MAKYRTIRFQIRDNLSGIDDFDTYIDNKWVVTDYDAKTASLAHHIDPNLQKGEHIFRVVVVDERKNRGEYSVKFVI